MFKNSNHWLLLSCLSIAKGCLAQPSCQQRLSHSSTTPEHVLLAGGKEDHTDRKNACSWSHHGANPKAPALLPGEIWRLEPSICTGRYPLVENVAEVAQHADSHSYLFCSFQLSFIGKEVATSSQQLNNVAVRPRINVASTKRMLKRWTRKMWASNCRSHHTHDSCCPRAANSYRNFWTLPSCCRQHQESIAAMTMKIESVNDKQRKLLLHRLNKWIRLRIGIEYNGTTKSYS